MSKIICPECGCDEFKEDYLLSEIYCRRCGRILLNSDKYGDECKSWKERGFRPNAWNICFVNNIFDYFPDDYNIYGG